MQNRFKPFDSDEIPPQHRRHKADVDALVEEFLATGLSCAECEWKDLGYKTARIFCNSLRPVIYRKNFPVKITARKDRIFFIRSEE